MYATREAWLQDAAGELAPIITAAGGTVPASLRIACGFPSTFRRSGALGETFRPTDSADSTVEVLISPTLSNPVEVLAVLLRQLLAAAGGKALATAAGLEPNQPRDIPAPSQTLLGALNTLADSLGAYPHAALSLADRPKAQTRLLKAVCPTCGYTIRLTAKWVAKGMPVCHDGDSFNLDTNSEA